MAFGMFSAIFSRVCASNPLSSTMATSTPGRCCSRGDPRRIPRVVPQRVALFLFLRREALARAQSKASVASAGSILRRHVARDELDGPGDDDLALAIGAIAVAELRGVVHALLGRRPGARRADELFLGELLVVGSPVAGGSPVAASLGALASRWPNLAMIDSTSSSSSAYPTYIAALGWALRRRSRPVIRRSVCTGVPFTASSRRSLCSVAPHRAEKVPRF